MQEFFAGPLKLVLPVTVEPVELPSVESVGWVVNLVGDTASLATTNGDNETSSWQYQTSFNGIRKGFYFFNPTLGNRNLVHLGRDGHFLVGKMGTTTSARKHPGTGTCRNPSCRG